MIKKIAIGVDIGGSHISCAAIDMESKEYLSNTFSESKLDNHAPANDIMQVLASTIEKTLLAAGKDNVAGVGFAMPGPFDYVNGISRFRGENGKFENTYGMNVPEGLRQFLGLDSRFKVRFINDATAFAIGEDRFGRAKNHKASLSITLGTGFGSAFINDKMPVLDGSSVPVQGCVWHLPFEDGIADDYFSTRGFLKRYYEVSGKQLDGVKELATLALEDPSARELFDDFGYKLGGFLLPWIQGSGSEILVIGGNISKAFPLFESALDRGFEEQAVLVATSELGESASMIGSAFLVDDDFYANLLPLLSAM